MPLSSALIVEPREHPASFASIRNVRENLGPEIPIIWFHGTKNKEFAQDIAEKIPNLKLREIPVDNLPSAGHYSSFMLNKNLWKELRHYARREPNSKTLVFQTDSGFCNLDTNKTLEHLSTLEEIDYVGAPAGGHHNGGFSYRDIDGMLKVATRSDNIEVDSGLWDSGYWLNDWSAPSRRPKAEDKVISATCKNLKTCRHANTEQGDKFSCCGMNKHRAIDEWPDALGFHGHKHHYVGRLKPFDALEELFAVCPEAEHII